VETILGGISKYSWRLFVGAFAAASALLFLGRRLGLSAWVVSYRFWLLGAFVFTGVVSFSYLMTYLADWNKRREKQGQIHFVPDAYNNGWSEQTESIMNVTVSGIFTYRGPGEVRIVKAYLAGTSSLDDLMVTVFRTDRDVTRQLLSLENDEPKKVMIHLRLSPVIGESDQELTATLVLLDNFNRLFRCLI
jgi:hypothetical protein